MIQKAKLPLIIFDALLILIIGYFMVGILFYPKSEQTVTLAGITQTEKEATESAKTKEEVSKIVENEDTSGQTKGTTQYIPPSNYQPTAKSKATTKKLAEVKKTIEKPIVQPPPDISEPPLDEELPFSDEHFEKALDLIDAIADADTQLDIMERQLLELEAEYANLPDVVAIRTRGQGLARYNLVLESEQDRVINEYNKLTSEYNLLVYDQNTWYSQLCSTYYDVLFYFSHESYCS